MIELVRAGLATATAERAIQKSGPHRSHFFARAESPSRFLVHPRFPDRRIQSIFFRKTRYDL
jgi:hypothetical protein